jgi:hypothetical protein
VLLPSYAVFLQGLTYLEEPLHLLNLLVPLGHPVNQQGLLPAFLYALFLPRLEVLV